MERLIKPAKEFLKFYFADGKEKRPCDFDEDIIGGMDFSFFDEDIIGGMDFSFFDEDIIGGIDFSFMLSRPKWNNTPFFFALGELVDEGVIKFKQLEDGQYVYWMPKWGINSTNIK